MSRSYFASVSMFVIALAALVLSAAMAWAPTTSGQTIHVDCANTTGIEDGTEAHPFDSIQEGIDAAIDGDTVLVHPCTYYENIDFLGKAITVASINPLDPALVSMTVVDGGGAGSVVIFDKGEGPDSTLTGLTVTNGVALRGGGIYCESSSPAIVSNVVTGNRGSGWGGGIVCRAGSRPTITGNTISENSSNRGGGVNVDESSPVITLNIITANRAGDAGGGIACSRSSSTIARNLISANTVGGNGGGMALSNCPATAAVESNIVVANRAGSSGGGIEVFGSPAQIVNCTISDNTASFGAGISSGYSSAAALCNCIVWDSIGVRDGSTVEVAYSNTLDAWPGEGNISVDPQFVDPANGDYHLLPTSPCIDVGLNECAPAADFDGEPRPWPPEGIVDMGADERMPPCECAVAIDRTHCKMPAAGHVGQCKTGHIGARNTSLTESCDVVLRVIDNAGSVVFETVETIGPGRRVVLRFHHCFTRDEIGRHWWAWEVWPVLCAERTPSDNTWRRRVNVHR